ncbi:MAG: sigma-E processing peptidase SpoIIGA, partial [Clostridia bacterium]|nr:sigma-E processing peptidase SpoIIGA [Clostridia bacterium]
MRVLYLDILFLVNFCMDYMALYIAGGLCERARSALRLLAASLLGAVYAMAAVLLTGNQAIQHVIGICVALLLVALAYGRSSRRDFMRVFITF